MPHAIFGILVYVALSFQLSYAHSPNSPNANSTNDITDRFAPDPSGEQWNIMTSTKPLKVKQIFLQHGKANETANYVQTRKWSRADIETKDCGSDIRT